MSDILLQVEEGLRRKRELEDAVDRLEQMLANEKVEVKRLQTQLQDVRAKCAVLEASNSGDVLGPLDEEALWAAGPSVTIELTNKLSGLRRCRIRCHGKIPVRAKGEGLMLGKVIKEFIRRGARTGS